MVILGDYVWLQHYHADLDIQDMPEYVLRHNRKDHGLYTLYSHYFAQRWESPEIPEYDLETDELVYRGRSGKEIRRERFESTPTPQLAKVSEKLAHLNPEPVQLAAPISLMNPLCKINEGGEMQR